MIGVRAPASSRYDRLSMIDCVQIRIVHRRLAETGVDITARALALEQVEKLRAAAEKPVDKLIRMLEGYRAGTGIELLSNRTFLHPNSGVRSLQNPNPRKVKK
jgi:hypothetical protein